MKNYLITVLALVIVGCVTWLWLNPSSDGQGVADKATRLLGVDTNPLPDFRQYPNVQAKKQAFFDYLGPIVATNNQQINEQRARIAAVAVTAKNNASAFADLNSADQRFLTAMIQRYEVDPEIPLEQQLVALLLRVDTIPVSLALTQAAMESAWGTSRFATEGNNLFGQWCYEQGCGLVPRNRGAGQKHEVARFASVDAAVSSYMRNINSHYAYADLRAARAAQRALEQPVTGHDLAEHLLNYSERGVAYVEELQAMIRINKLAPLDLGVPQ